MDAEQIYHVWAPAGPIWSRWATPALFAQMKSPIDFDLPTENAFLKSNTDWMPDPVTGSALIIDLPGPEAVWMATIAAQRGYRPVPIINACNGASTVVDMDRILLAMYGMTPLLKTLQLPENAPPVFFLDSLRMTGTARPDWFDNRWIVFPQDFPSGNFLASQNVKSIQLVQKASGQPQTDLAHVLLRWQEAGLSILVKASEEVGPAQPLVIEKPARYRKLWYRALALFGLRRNSAGGFGDVVPNPDESSGFG